jgi:hypothetical protein
MPILRQRIKPYFIEPLLPLLMRSALACCAIARLGDLWAFALPLLLAKAGRLGQAEGKRQRKSAPLLPLLLPLRCIAKSKGCLCKATSKGCVATVKSKGRHKLTDPLLLTEAPLLLTTLAKAKDAKAKGNAKAKGHGV